MALALDPGSTLPRDGDAGTLIGRVWRRDRDGPSVVVARDGALHDISSAASTVRDLCEAADPATLARSTAGELVGSISDILANTPRNCRDTTRPWLLAPVDLQAIKAAGVTFAVSMLERVVEEQARGNPDKAVEFRASVVEIIGDDLSRLQPGSEEAAALKRVLIEKGAWSQYLEVGIGPDAEVFTKAPVLSAVGTGFEIGVHPHSTWNNPEPEIALFVSGAGRIVGATLGNDVNLRDFEGRSALLLSKAKDNTASAALGPFLRLFDGTFTLDDVRRAEVRLTVAGDDGFEMEDVSSMGRISRDPADLVAQTIGPNHQYPDGFVLYLGTMFAPTQDRQAPGQGFTHEVGDIVNVASAQLGALTNRVVCCPDAEPWTFGIADLMRNLAARKLI
jgi:fumarylacetoacetate (FAA) hydrolase family protein